jgi:LmbE family N-acetylglucosaminyl deacetylase
MSAHRRVLAVFAHPDDETYGPGGTLARLSDEGAEVRLITLTRGESATMGDSPRYSPELLADVRERELECACRALGIAEHETFGFPDRALEKVPRGELAAPVSRALEDFRPHLAITFHREGISGHMDHRIVSGLLSELISAGAEEAAGPEAHPEPRLAYYSVPDSLGIKVEWRSLFTVPDGMVTHALDVSAYFEAKTAAAECHKTQRYMLERLSAVQGGLREMWAREYFIVEGDIRRGAPRPELWSAG